MRLIIAYLLNGVANGLPATLFFLFVGEVLNVGHASGWLLLLYFVAGIVGIPIWLRISKAIGKHRAWAAAMLWASAMFVWAPFLGEGDLLLFTCVCALSGLSLGADMALPASIQADVVDLDWQESGRQRTGLFFALWSMATKLSLALAIGIAFPLLDFIGFEAGGDNEPSALLGLAVLYGFFPVVIKVLATTLVWRFPIDADGSGHAPNAACRAGAMTKGRRRYRLVSQLTLRPPRPRAFRAPTSAHQRLLEAR